ncbi:MAG: transglycosylase SLT domain-containing protein [bacterium]|nr:transglycosylase SLT domain-containing protein [bacterium]
MKISRFIIVFIVFATVFASYQHLFSWGLFNLFSDTSFSEEGLQKSVDFDPDKDILYLPKLEGKKLFESVDDLSICRKKDVRKYIYIYLTTGRKFAIRSIERSYLYMGIIDDIFEKNSDIPKDIALLPLLESGFSPNAVSRSKAMGLWQFMKSTSKPLGLKRNKWVDERRDIEKSTNAAIRHLRHLHKSLGSWELALAAYNGGGGHVRRSMKKSGTSEIWSLIDSGAMKQEPSEYVPRYLALLLIYKNQSLFGIKDEISIPETFDTENITLEFPVNIKDVSKVCEVPLKTIKKFNPELNHHITPPYNKEYSLRLPAEVKDKFKLNKKKLYKYKFKGVKRYTVKRGDNLSSIAKRHKKKLVSLLS